MGLYSYKLHATDPFQLIYECLILHDFCEIVRTFVHKILITGDMAGKLTVHSGISVWTMLHEAVCFNIVFLLGLLLNNNTWTFIY